MASDKAKMLITFPGSYCEDVVEWDPEGLLSYCTN